MPRRSRWRCATAWSRCAASSPTTTRCATPPTTPGTWRGRAASAARCAGPPPARRAAAARPPAPSRSIEPGVLWREARNAGTADTRIDQQERRTRTSGCGVPFLYGDQYFTLRRSGEAPQPFDLVLQVFRRVVDHGDAVALAFGRERESVDIRELRSATGGHLAGPKHQ